MRKSKFSSTNPRVTLTVIVKAPAPEAVKVPMNLENVRPAIVALSVREPDPGWNPTPNTFNDAVSARFWPSWGDRSRVTVGWSGSDWGVAKATPTKATKAASTTARAARWRR